MEKFGANKIITQFHDESNISSFYVGYDLTSSGGIVYRVNELIELLMLVVPEFAFGTHIGTSVPLTQVTKIMKESAKSIYKIDSFKEARAEYLTSSDTVIEVDDKYLKRGEFGELILHLLLRDFYDTIPLVSKIYFKDSYGSTVHGFDAVHIEPNSEKIWLGESKLYSEGKKGVKELIEDLKNHITRDYLNDEFTIISKKIDVLDNIKEKDYWLDLLDSKTKLGEQIKSITIPLLCTYSCGIFANDNDEDSDEFKKAFDEEITKLNDYFVKHNNHPLKDKLDIILILFPIRCKNEVIKKLHTELTLYSGGL